MVQVCGPLPFVVHELVVEQAAGLVALLFGADHGHHRFVALLAGLSAILKQKNFQNSNFKFQICQSFVMLGSFNMS